jgi:peptide deformylase
MNISDYLTHVDNKEDTVFLKSVLFDVNIRLFNSNPIYRAVVAASCNLIRFAALNKMDGYKLPHGMSGANVGVPFNIIGIVKNRGTKNAYCQIMINPKIKQYLGELIETDTNCGSIRLEKPIKIKRYESVHIEYFDESRKRKGEVINRYNGSFTVQHEVDHNLGILITDKI